MGYAILLIVELDIMYVACIYTDSYDHVANHFKKLGLGFLLVFSSYLLFLKIFFKENGYKTIIIIRLLNHRWSGPPIRILI